MRLLVAAALALAPASATTINAVDNRFDPSTATVNVGDKVTWQNNGTTSHEVYSTTFASGNLAKGESWSWTATKAGTFSYVCRYHQSAGMKGTLVVRASAGHPNTGGDRVALGLLLVGVSAIAGASLRYGWRVR